MMTVLLDLAGVREENGIMPHSLKVTTISAIIGEIVKGKENLAQLAAQGNYRAVTSRDMGNVYSRNSAQQQQHIFVSKFAQKSFSENTNADGPPNDLPGFSEKVQGGRQYNKSRIPCGKASGLGSFDFTNSENN